MGGETAAWEKEDDPAGIPSSQDISFMGPVGPVAVGFWGTLEQVVIAQASAALPAKKSFGLVDFVVISCL